MEWLSADFFIALLSIIMIDLVLAGDNAIVIGLAARNVPKEQQKKVIFWGTAGAVIIRIIGTVLVVQLLKIPGLLLIGGVLLVWIAYKFLADKKGSHEIQSKASMSAAIRTIIIADAAMGVDNILAVAGAAHGDFTLVVIGLLITVPIIVWGSTLFIKLIDRYPVIIYIGAAILAYTAAKMIVEEKFVHGLFEDSPVFKWTVIVIITLGTVLAGKLKSILGYVVQVGDRGQLTLPNDLSSDADIKEEDQFTVARNDKGQYVLVKHDRNMIGQSAG